MPSIRLFLVAALLFAAGAGCGGKKKEITSLERKQAAALVSEAEFAATLRDWPRAEGLLAQAAELVPDTGELWLKLGSTRMKLGRRDSAKAAYKNAYDAFDDQMKAKKTDPEPRLQQVTVLALLGHPENARELLEKTARDFPDHRDVRLFIEQKRLDRMLADPQFKELAL